MIVNAISWATQMAATDAVAQVSCTCHNIDKFLPILEHVVLIFLREQ